MTESYKQGVDPIKRLVDADAISIEYALHMTRRYYNNLININDAIFDKKMAVKYTKEYIIELEQRLQSQSSNTSN